MRLYAFIPCTKTKAGHRCPARDMYWPSAGFRAAWEYAQAHGLQVIIFSAKYGVLLPNDVIDPYDLSLIGAGRDARERWASQVAQQLNTANPDRVAVGAGDLVVSFLPRDYGAILHQMLHNAGVEVREPLQGRRPGERLAWFKQHREATDQPS